MGLPSSLQTPTRPTCLSDGDTRHIDRGARGKAEMPVASDARPSLCRERAPIGEEDALDLVLRLGQVPADLVRRAGDAELRVLLPLLLCAPPQQDVLDALQARICASRGIKLRFQLLRAHPVFEHFPCERRYSSAAYEPLQSGAESTLQVGSRAVVPADEGGKEGKIRFFVDMVDLQSEDFFQNTVYAGVGNESVTFGHVLICHPFGGMEADGALGGTLGSDSEEPPDEASLGDCDIAQTAFVKRVHGRAVVGLRRICAGAETLRLNCLEPLMPEMVVRADGTGLRAVAGQMLLRVLSAAWARPCRQFPDGAAAPFCVAVDVVATAAGRSVERLPRKAVPLSAFNFDYWRYTKGLNPVSTDAFVRSAAGLYTAGFVCGLQDRGGEDVGVTDGIALYFRDTRGAFEHYGGGPGAAPRLAVSKAMREAFRQLAVWDAFRDTCVRAYAVLRESHREVFGAVYELFRRAGVPKERIVAHLYARHGLNLSERDRTRADAHFRRWLG